MEFEWDPAKADTNSRRHSISFEEVTELFTSGVDYLEIFDDEHSQDEDRFIAIGPIPAGLLCIGILFSFKYPLTRGQYAQVTQELESRRAKQIHEAV